MRMRSASFAMKSFRPFDARQSERFRVVVVGFGAGPAVEALTEIPEVELAGSVPDVSPWYRAADVVVVPVRAGGGTRIKVLEAFAYRRAVVSTTLGCEGISVCDGQHVLLADTARGAWPRSVSDLMRDPELRARLGTQAHALVRARYTLEAVARRLWVEHRCVNRCRLVEEGKARHVVARLSAGACEQAENLDLQRHVCVHTSAH